MAGGAYLGGWYFGAIVVLIALAAQHEFYAMLQKGGSPAWNVAGFLLGGLLILSPLWKAAIPLGVLLVVGMVVWTVFASGANPAHYLAGTLVGAVYPAGLLGYMLALRVAQGPRVGNMEAFYLLLTLFLLIWATDIMAYFVGRGLGRHPLAPTISPKKTWEGAIGGALGAMGVAVVLKITLLPFLGWPHLVVLALICGVISQLGDLAESRIKRAVSVKDSGTLLPGHGGVLDRFDAMILAAPVMYLYLKYIAQLYV